MARWLGLGLWLLLAVACSAPHHFAGSVFQPPVARPDLTLQGPSGPVSLSQFRGRPVALFFGYTSCPDVCPTSLAYLRDAVKKLVLTPQQLQVVFVSVDWKTDTPTSTQHYAQGFSADFLGVTGSQTAIDQAVHDYAIYYKMTTPDAQGRYTVDHTATIFLLDAQGRLQLTWPYGTTPEAIADDLRMVLAAQP